MNINTTSGQAVAISEEAFGRDFNEALVHQVVTAYLAGGRQGTKAQKNRAAVSGGGAKPWRQKGTGRARSGTTRSPIWRTGGVTFAASPRDHAQKVNKKMYRGAMRCILSELIRQDRLVVVDDITVESPKTKLLLAQLKALELANVLIVTQSEDQNLYLSARNIPHVEVRDVQGCDPVGLMSFEKVLMTVDSLKKIEGELV